MSDQPFVTKFLKETMVTRRSFLKWSAALGGTAALAGGVSVGLKAAEQAASEETELLTTACYHNCGGRCILVAEVKDGAVVRLLPDQDIEDTFENPRAIPCVRGRSQIRRVYAAERLKYPMKRVGKRGENKFERITWEEALDSIAGEMKRIKQEYGNEAFFFHYASGTQWSGPDGRAPVRRLMRLYGGYTDYYGTYSSACYSAALPYITNAGSNSMDDLVNAKLVVLFADNPMVTRAGGDGAGYYYLKAKEAGAKIIVVDPRYTDSAAALEAEWIPIYPGTDVALIAAMAYVMVVEGLYDSDFVSKYTVGFDEGNLPEGAPPNSSWMAYITGQADGTPKTPKWASKITGIPVDRIIKLAREIATTKPCAMYQGLGWQRRAYGEQPVRALPILAAMSGNVGIAGGGVGTRSSSGNSVSMGSFPVPENPIKSVISVFMWPDFVTRGNEMTSGPRDRIKGVEKLNSSMKFMWNHGGNTITNQHSDINGTIKMLEDDTKLECIVTVEVAMTPSCLVSDYILPATTGFEADNIITGGGNGGSAWAMFSHKVIEPLYENREELWIAEQVADRLGIGDEFREGHASREDWMREMVAGAKEKDENFPSYEEFKAKGIYKKTGGGGKIGLKDFVADPVANPLKTETGKIEIYSPFLASLEDPDEIPAIPKYIPEWEGVEDPLRKKYPLLMVGHHIISRSHSTFENVDYLKEIHPQAIWINTLDAQKRGIANGETVKVFNDRGEVHLPAFVTNRIRPGVTSMPQGAWHTPDANGVDTRGCINTLTKYHPTPFAKGNPQHTNLVQVEKL